MNQQKSPNKAPSKDAIIRELWTRGLLEYKMHSVQKEMY